MKKGLILLLVLCCICSINAQKIEFRKNISKDSLFNMAVKKLPEFKRDEYANAYYEGNEAEKEFLLYMISLPKSSKEELIQNYELKKINILELKKTYNKLIPENYVVDIEIEPKSEILTIEESITIKIYSTIRNENKTELDTLKVKRSDKYEVVSVNRNLNINCEEIKNVLKSIGWSNETLIKIKGLLKNAGCVSIKNGKTTTIGYARSGMGKYSYKIFDENLSKKEQDIYNDGCNYIYHNENIVLEYGGGAIGPQCF